MLEDIIENIDSGKLDEEYEVRFSLIKITIVTWYNITREKK